MDMNSRRFPLEYTREKPLSPTNEYVISCKRDLENKKWEWLFFYCTFIRPMTAKTQKYRLNIGRLR